VKEAVTISAIDLADVQAEVRDAEAKALEGLTVTIPLVAMKKLLRLARVGQAAEEARVKRNGAAKSWGPSSKLSEDDKERIRARLKEGDPIPVIAEDFVLPASSIVGMRLRMIQKGDLEP